MSRSSNNIAAIRSPPIISANSPHSILTFDSFFTNLTPTRRSSERKPGTAVLFEA